MSATESRLMDVEELSALTGISRSTLHEWAQKRDAGLSAPGPPHLALSPGHRRWAREDVDRWLAEARRS